MVLGYFRSFHVLVLTLRVLGLPYSSSHNGSTVLTQTRFIVEFCLAISTAGLSEASSFQGHSLRRGADSWAFINHGVPGDLIQINVD